MQVLILGGTSEATALAQLLARRRDYQATMSLAGRTSEPAAQPIPVRIGGFGGAEGLANYLTENRISALIDATHPFAEQISKNAAAASEVTGVPVCALTRAPWTPIPGDNWTQVDSLVDAANAIGTKPKKVLLTVGRLGLASFLAAPQHNYVIRSIDPPADVGLPRVKVILDRPPFDAESEERLMRSYHIEVLVTKNSGGKATSGKLIAARNMGIPVIMVRQPARREIRTYTKPNDVMIWLARQAKILQAKEEAAEVADVPVETGDAE